MYVYMIPTSLKLAKVEHISTCVNHFTANLRCKKNVLYSHAREPDFTHVWIHYFHTLLMSDRAFACPVSKHTSNNHKDCNFIELPSREFC